MKSGALALAILAAAGLGGCGGKQQEITYPQTQRAFHALNAQCRASFQAGANQIQQSQAFNECNRQRRQFGETNAISGWGGTIDVIATDQGASEVRISIDADADGFLVEYNTPGAGAFDADSPNVVRPGSPVFDALAAMKTGDRVLFDGEFLPDPDRGIRESSLTEAGSMQEPVFYLRLTGIRPYGAATTPAAASPAHQIAPTAAAASATPPAPPVHASFDCAKANAAVEKLVCSDADLAQLDRELAQAYVIALRQVAEPEFLKRSQRAWVKGTRDTCGDVACVAGAYQARIEELGNIDAPTAHPTPESAYVDGSGVGYAFSSDGNGAVLKSEATTIHLGQACDAVSPELGNGTWGWANGGFSIEFPTASIGFPRQEIDLDNDGGCQL